MQQATEQLETIPAFEIYTYPATDPPPMPSWEAFGDFAIDVEASKGTPLPGAEAEIPETRSEDTARIDEEMRHSFEAGREQGFTEGQAAEREALSSGLKAKDAGHVEQAARVLENFHAQQERYFEQVEHEVVKLALAVAARILRREAQMDPLLLTGAVRVALGQLSASTKVRLQVPEADLELWADTIAHLPKLPVKPVVVAGEGMRLGDCVVETEMGSVDLGVRAQLGEIERGFFDRAERTAAVAKATISEEMAE